MHFYSRRLIRMTTYFGRPLRHSLPVNASSSGFRSLGYVSVSAMGFVGKNGDVLLFGTLLRPQGGASNFRRLCFFWGGVRFAPLCAHITPTRHNARPTVDQRPRRPSENAPNLLMAVLPMVEGEEWRNADLAVNLRPRRPLEGFPPTVLPVPQPTTHLLRLGASI